LVWRCSSSTTVECCEHSGLLRAQWTVASTVGCCAWNDDELLRVMLIKQDKVFFLLWRTGSQWLYNQPWSEEKVRLEISISQHGAAISGSIQKKQLFCRMDTTSVVLRHAAWSRDRGGLGWRCFVIPSKGGAWWNRFPWAKSKLKRKRDDCPDSENARAIVPVGEVWTQIEKLKGCVATDWREGLNLRC